MRVRLFSVIGHVMTKIDWEEPTNFKTCMYTVFWGLKYDDIRKGKTCDHGIPVADTYCFVYFILS